MTLPLGMLEQLLALSEGMLAAAESGDWEVLAAREAERQALTDSLRADLAGELAPEASARARTLIEGCQNCDARTRPLVESRLEELRVVLRQARSAA